MKPTRRTSCRARSSRVVLAVSRRCHRADAVRVARRREAADAWPRASRRPTSTRRRLEAVAADRQVLAKLVEASKIIDALFLRQVWAGNEAMLLDLVARRDARGPRAAALLPDQQGSVVAARSQRAVRARRAGEAGGGELLSRGRDRRRELERWIQSLPEAERARATGFFTVVRRGPTGGFALVPYNVEYQNELARAAALLREAAALAARADAEDVSRRSAPTRSSRTTTTTATSPGWS